MSDALTLFHGSPIKLAVGDYLRPEFCGRWEDCRIYNPKTARCDTDAIYFIKSFDIALQYARREIYAPTDGTTDTKFFIFNRPDYETYVYQVAIAPRALITPAGRPATHFEGEVCATTPVQIIRRHTFDISCILQYYGDKEHQNTIARLVKRTFDNHDGDRFIAPFSFGMPGGLGMVTFNRAKLVRDIIENTSLIPGVTPYVGRRR